jgi:Zinc finger, C2H2 type
VNGDLDANPHQSTGLLADGSTIGNTDLDNILSGPAVGITYRNGPDIQYDPVPRMYGYDGPEREPTTEEWQHYFNLDPETFPSDQSLDADPSNATGLGTSVDNSPRSPAALGPGSVATPTSSIHQCTTCMKTFSRRTHLRRHAQGHDPNAPRLTCPRPGCGCQFLRKDKLAAHLQTHDHLGA